MAKAAKSDGKPAKSAGKPAKVSPLPHAGRRRGGKPWTKYPKSAILEAIGVCDGFKSRVYRALGMDSGTLDRYLARFPDLREAFEQSKREVDDLAESQLVANIRAGDERAIEFYLERRMPERYGKRPEVQVGVAAQGDEVRLWLSAAAASWGLERRDDGDGK